MSTNSEIKEKLAAIEHERWADWQKWCHEVLRGNLPDHYVTALNPVLERWDKQIETPYSELSEEEKQSDRDQVDRYWPLIEQLLDEARLAELEQLKNSIGDWDGTIDYRIAELQAKLNKGE